MQPKPVLSLAEARAKSAPLANVGKWMADLRLALTESVSCQDVALIVAKLKEKALVGDLSAMKLFLAYTVGAPGSEDAIYGPCEPRLAERRGPSQQQALVINADTVNVPGTPAGKAHVNSLLEQRRRVVEFIAHEGPQQTEAIATLIGKPAIHIGKLMAHEWFETETDGWHVTNQARAEVLDVG